jgi:hypothetical protein
MPPILPINGVLRFALDKLQGTIIRVNVACFKKVFIMPGKYCFKPNVLIRITVLISCKKQVQIKMTKTDYAIKNVKGCFLFKGIMPA